MGTARLRVATVVSKRLNNNDKDRAKNSGMNSVIEISVHGGGETPYL